MSTQFTIPSEIEQSPDTQYPCLLFFPAHSGNQAQFDRKYQKVNNFSIQYILDHIQINAVTDVKKGFEKLDKERTNRNNEMFGVYSEEHKSEDL